MLTPQRRDVSAGAVAGLLGGTVLSIAMVTQGNLPGLLGLKLLDLGQALNLVVIALHLLIAALLGMGFGAIFRYQPGGYAATISSGLLYGLLWWIVGPLTLMPLLLGQGPTWSLKEANAVFSSLIGHLLYGGITAFSFYLLISLYLRARPETETITPPPQAPTKRIVILGGGFGGVSTAQRLEELFAREPNVDITLVSQSNYLLFTPMLAEVASSGLEPQHISAPVRASCPRTHFVRADVESIDTDEKIVRVRVGKSVASEALSYDHLVLALGSIPNYFGLPGLEANSFTLKSLHDATKLRNHVITLLEEADSEPKAQKRRELLSFVVAGGGFAGTEMIAELFDFVHSVRRYYPHIQSDEPRFVLVHSQDRILPELSAELGAYALDKLQKRGIEFFLNARVAGATPEKVMLNDGREILTKTLVWTAGNQPNPVLKTLPCEHTKAGAIVAEPTLQAKGFTNLWAVGDCAQIPDVLNAGKFHPTTAQHALREGKVLAENVAAALRGQTLKPFKFRTIGILVALGHRTAAAEVRGRRFSGLLAWVMWRTIYFSKLPGLEKKVRVAFDWALDLFFPRDIVLTSNVLTPTLTQMMGTTQMNGITPAKPATGMAKEN
ncbi:NAD(P)/FAD-dependent oxidoreductase [Candidatus Acetothermia bacterium]|nr:NAD(P)/FAD-dependent oxidoreductase [Candidatus Acetothermia bacterium]